MIYIPLIYTICIHVCLSNKIYSNNLYLINQPKQKQDAYILLCYFLFKYKWINHNTLVFGVYNSHLMGQGEFFLTFLRILWCIHIFYLVNKNFKLTFIFQIAELLFLFLLKSTTTCTLL